MTISVWMSAICRATSSCTARNGSTPDCPAMRASVWSLRWRRLLHKPQVHTCVFQVFTPEYLESSRVFHDLFSAASATSRGTNAHHVRTTVSRRFSCTDDANRRHSKPPTCTVCADIACSMHACTMHPHVRVQCAPCYSGGSSTRGCLTPHACARCPMPVVWLRAKAHTDPRREERPCSPQVGPSQTRAHHSPDTPHHTDTVGTFAAGDTHATLPTARGPAPLRAQLTRRAHVTNRM